MSCLCWRAWLCGGLCRPRQWRVTAGSGTYIHRFNAPLPLTREQSCPGGARGLGRAKGSRRAGAVLPSQVKLQEDTERGRRAASSRVLRQHRLQPAAPSRVPGPDVLPFLLLALKPGTGRGAAFTPGPGLC